MLVEDIQDIIEQKLMEMGKFILAKKYIIYRYTRSIIRKSNTTDASILSLLKNSNVQSELCLSANRQRDLIAGEVSKDLSCRLLLPPNVTIAIQNNYINFCNIEYFTEPIIDSCLLDLNDMFENSTVINGVKIETPKSFQSACNVLVEIIASIASCQTGNIYINLKDLYRFYDISFNKKYKMYNALMKNSLTEDQIKAFVKTQISLEVNSGLQTIFYQINTIITSSGLVPKVFFLVNTSDISNPQYETIVSEFIKQKTNGIINNNDKYTIMEYPKIIYSLNEDNNVPKTMYYYLTEELINSEADFYMMNEYKFINFVNDIKKFNQGTIALNIAKIVIENANNFAKFEESLKNILDACYEGFLCRNHNLQGISSKLSPMHWQNGAIARLKDNEKIDGFLKENYSYQLLAVCGFDTAVSIFGDDCKKQIKAILTDTIKKWNKENDFDVIISNYYNDKIVDEFYNIDKNLTKQFNIKSYYDDIIKYEKDSLKSNFIVYKHNENIIETLKEKDVIIERSVKNEY